MGKHTRTAVAVAALGAGLLAVAVVGADAKGGTTDAKAGSVQSAGCIGDGTAALSLGYNKSGSRVTFAVSGSGGAWDDAWIIGLDDNGAGLSAFGAQGSDWTVIDNQSMGKGEHVVSMTASNGFETCTASVAFKI